MLASRTYVLVPLQTSLSTSERSSLASLTVSLLILFWRKNYMNIYTTICNVILTIIFGSSRLLAAKKQMFQTGKGLDWATAEALAFGTLLLEGHHVRLAGQDSQRGPFSHRHAVMHDQNTGKTWFPLPQLATAKASIDIVDSTLSEFGVLGFELGYSLESPHALVVWEAEFGDFSNGAQVIIDQFLSSGEKKWHRQSGLVMLLPHGYEGGGPEHSSSRMERYLQLCDSDPDRFPTGEELASLDQVPNTADITTDRYAIPSAISLFLSKLVSG